MRIRTTAAAVFLATAGTLGLGAVAYAQTDQRDCEDYGSQREAQAVLDSPAGDPKRLDADRDGRACEIWFANRGDAASSDAASSEDGRRVAADPDTDDSASTGPARQVTPVPRGGVDTGYNPAGPVRSNPAILLVAALMVAGTAAAGAAAAQGATGNRPVPAGPRVPTRRSARGVAGAPARPNPATQPPLRPPAGAGRPEAPPPARAAA